MASWRISCIAETQRWKSSKQTISMSCADARAFALKKQSVDFSMLCRDLLEDAEVLALRKLIQIKSEIVPNIYVKGDESYLSRLSWRTAVKSGSNDRRLDGPPSHSLSPNRWRQTPCQLVSACCEMSRRDGAIVAWHEVPGTAPPQRAVP